MKASALKARTYAFGVNIINFSKSLPDTIEARRVRGQLTDAGTSVAANYRGACRARARAEFIAKMGVCCEEADVTASVLTAKGRNRRDRQEGDQPYEGGL